MSLTHEEFIGELIGDPVLKICWVRDKTAGWAYQKWGKAIFGHEVSDHEHKQLGYVKSYHKVYVQYFWSNDAKRVGKEPGTPMQCGGYFPEVRFDTPSQEEQLERVYA